MLRNYDAWLTTDRHAEAGGQVVGYDLLNRPVTESDLSYYKMIDGYLVENTYEDIEEFLAMDKSDLLEFARKHYNVIDEVTVQDL